MLEQWLKEETIAIRDEVKDWREAVALSAKPLLDAGTIVADYVTAIYRQHETIGPYYVLAPGIAMPHARPEEGAKGMGLSLLVVKNGVSFHSEDNDPVHLIVMLAAPDGNHHIEMISQLAELFSSQEDVEQLIQSNSVNDIQKIINKY